MKQYNVKGVASTVEIGKQGPKIVGSANSVALQDKDGNAENLIMAAGTDAEHAVTLTQLEAETGFRVMTVNETVTYDGGSQYLFTAKANTIILGIMIEKTAGNWAGYDAATNITIGDAGDTDRLLIKAGHQMAHRLLSILSLSIHLIQLYMRMSHKAMLQAVVQELGQAHRA